MESSKGVCRIVKGCPRNRERVSAESSKSVRRFVEGHQHSHNHQRHPQNRTVFLEKSKSSRLVVVEGVESS